MRNSSAALRLGTTMAVARAVKPSGTTPAIADWKVRRSEARSSLVTRGVINVSAVERA